MITTSNKKFLNINEPGIYYNIYSKNKVTAFQILVPDTNETIKKGPASYVLNDEMFFEEETIQRISKSIDMLNLKLTIEEQKIGKLNNLKAIFQINWKKIRASRKEVEKLIIEKVGPRVSEIIIYE